MAMEEPLLANEILQLIVNNSQDDIPTLQRLSLVSHFFFRAARPHIWRRVVLRASPDVHHGQLSVCAKLRNILIGPDSPAGHIEDFCIEDTEDHALSEDREIIATILDLLVDEDGNRILSHLSLLKIEWPSDLRNPLIIAIRGLVVAAPLTVLTIDTFENVPTFLIDECGGGLDALNLRGSSLYKGIRNMPHPPSAQPRSMILGVESLVEKDIWRRINTSRLQTLLIIIPHWPEPTVAMFNAFEQYGHNLRTLCFDFMEDGEADGVNTHYPNFSPLVGLRGLLIAFPTWIDQWPLILAEFIQYTKAWIPNLEYVNIYLVVSVPESDSDMSMDVSDDEDNWYQSPGFPELDHELSTLQSPNLTNIQIALCANGEPDTDLSDATPNVWNQLPVTATRGLLSVRAVRELPWESTFRS